MPSEKYNEFSNMMLGMRKNQKQITVKAQREGDNRIPFVGYCQEGVTYENYQILGVDVEHLKLVGAPKSDTVIVHIHGGAFMSGSSFATRNFTSTLCYETGHEVISIDYRLAPEHKWPNGLEDCFKVFNHVSKLYKTVYLVGPSAGGNLCCSMMHKLIDNNCRLPDKVCLMSPTTFFDTEEGTHTDRVSRDPMCGVPNYTTDKIGFYVEPGTDLRNKYISPLYGDLSKFPELLIFVGTEELLFDDSVLLYAKAVMSGVKAELVVGEGYMHVFPVMFREFPEIKPYFDKIVHYFAK